MRRTAAPSQIVENGKTRKLFHVTHVLPASSAIPAQICSSGPIANIQYYSVAYGKPSKRKHKTWEGDGFLAVSVGLMKLISSEGKQIGSSMRSSSVKVALEEGSSLHIGGKYVEVLSAVDSPSFDSIGKGALDSSTDSVGPAPRKYANKEFKPVMAPLSTVSSTGNAISNGLPLIIMPRPTASHNFKHNPDCHPIRDVIFDPKLARRMRPHQIDGVIFMYECVAGFRAHNGTGAILADAMGLGKTIQAIALISIVLHQGPYENETLIKKCLIVCPSSLVLNWKNEFEKWIGTQIIPFCISGDVTIDKFTESPSSSVLILSYEMLIRHVELLQASQFGLIICDEAHRLKHGSNKTFLAVESLQINRRILLTGTPLQNDMDEFFNLVQFSNPGVLGCSKDSFRQRFVNPINTARQPGASNRAIEEGNEACLILQRLTQTFILRRTEIVNTLYLPPKDEYIIFCLPTPVQKHLYKMLIECKTLQKELEPQQSNGAAIDALACILLLRKLCNDPILLIRYVMDKGNRSAEPDNCDKEKKESQSLLEEIRKKLQSAEYENPYWREILAMSIEHLGEHLLSGKLWVTAQMLMCLNSCEKLVLVSHFTQTLDLLGQLCRNLDIVCQRIDGSTPSAARMRIVSDFNKLPSSREVLLLSCKAGGEGLNLIGASRIILYDIDWNPATDAQAMARVWRDGQKGMVSVYRLVTTGTVEESLLQRQVAKQQLSTSLVDLTSSNLNLNTFSKEELRNIFTFHIDSVVPFGCWTHQLLNCGCHENSSPTRAIDQLLLAGTNPDESHTDACCELGIQQIQDKHSSSSSLSQLNIWSHWVGEADIAENCTDNFILQAISMVSCVFQRTVNCAEVPPAGWQA